MSNWFGHWMPTHCYIETDGPWWSGYKVQHHKKGDVYSTKKSTRKNDGMIAELSSGGVVLRQKPAKPGSIKMVEREYRRRSGTYKFLQENCQQSSDAAYIAADNPESTAMWLLKGVGKGIAGTVVLVLQWWLVLHLLLIMHWQRHNMGSARGRIEREYQRRSGTHKFLGEGCQHSSDAAYFAADAPFDVSTMELFLVGMVSAYIAADIAWHGFR